MVEGVAEVVEDGDVDVDVDVEEADGMDAVGVDEGVAVGVEEEGITVVETTTVVAGGVKPPYVHSAPRGI